jgi:hypothetical protein
VSPAVSSGAHSGAAAEQTSAYRIGSPRQATLSNAKFWAADLVHTSTIFLVRPVHCWSDPGEHGVSGTYYTSFGLMGQTAPTGEIFLRKIFHSFSTSHELGCHTFAHCHAYDNCSRRV